MGTFPLGGRAGDATVLLPCAPGPPPRGAPGPAHGWSSTFSGDAAAPGPPSRQVVHTVVMQVRWRSLPPGQQQAPSPNKSTPQCSSISRNSASQDRNTSDVFARHAAGRPVQRPSGQPCRCSDHGAAGWPPAAPCSALCRVKHDAAVLSGVGQLPASSSPESWRAARGWPGSSCLCHGRDGKFYPLFSPRILNPAASPTPEAANLREDGQDPQPRPVAGHQSGGHPAGSWWLSIGRGQSWSRAARGTWRPPAGPWGWGGQSPQWVSPGAKRSRMSGWLL